LKSKQIVRLFSLPWETKTNNLQPLFEGQTNCKIIFSAVGNQRPTTYNLTRTAGPITATRFWLSARAAGLVFGHCLTGK